MYNDLNLYISRCSAGMGAFISTISHDKNLRPGNSVVWSQPLQKIKQYHGMFKYVCDSFVINQEQFKEIFGSLDKAKIWDPDSIGKVDALQLFCGLTMFAKEASFKKKLSFLFSIFDFNEIKSLSFIDVEVIILNVCNSVYKIFNKNGKVNQNEIADWLLIYLPKKQRVKITQLYHLCTHNQDIRSFFTALNTIFGQDLIALPQIQGDNNQQAHQDMQKSVRPAKTKQQKLENMQWHKDLCNKIVKAEAENEQAGETNYGCRITWVYGINMQGSCRPFLPLKKSGACIAYKVSSMVIVYQLELDKQHILGGHKFEVSCFAYNQKNQVLCSVEDCPFPSIHFWRKQKYLKSEPVFDRHASIRTNHSQGIKMIEFVTKQPLLATIGKRSDSPILIYNYEKLQVAYQILLNATLTSIFNPMVLIQPQEAPASLDDTFFVLCSNNRIHEITLQPSPLLPLTSAHQYYDLPAANKINRALSCYLNVYNPYLRSYRDKSAGMVLITGHESGSVCLITTCGKYEEEEIVAGLGAPVLGLAMTGAVLAVGAGTQVYLYDLEVLGYKGAPLMTVGLRDSEGLELISYEISHFDFVKDFLLVLTSEGEFVRINTNDHTKTVNSAKPITTSLQSQPASNTPELHPQLLQTLLKFSHPRNIFCLLHWRPAHETILVSSHGNKILGIDSHSHQVHDVWQISSAQVIVCIDAVCSDDGTCYIICACRSGRLYIRIDWEQSPKYYDCGSEIVDARLSRDCSYLLVATKSNYLLFFTQVNGNFTSPRKLLFEYETPCSINFLDNFKFFLVVTSAKNSYLIEIPQLKHKKVHKETEKINISRVEIKYPNYSSNRELTYSAGCLGGAMKFSLVAMEDQDMYFFSSPNALERGNYTVLNAHKGKVSHVAVNEPQTKFYSLGADDNALIEWSVFKTIFRGNNNIHDLGEAKAGYDQNETTAYFEDIKQFARYKSDQIQSEGEPAATRGNNLVYFFKGTKLDRLNDSISAYYNSFVASLEKRMNSLGNSESPFMKPDEINEQEKTGEENIDAEYLQKRAPGISLIATEIYGLDTHHKSSITYINNGQDFLGYSSRFIIQTNIKTMRQTILEPTSNRISHLVCSEDGQVLYSVLQPRPRIYLLHGPSLATTHSQGIIHMTVRGNHVLSYGIAQHSGYSINLHDYRAGELISYTYTDVRVSEFLILSQAVAVSLGQVRVWRSLYPSEVVVTAYSGCVLPNGRDVLLGLSDGRFGVLSDRGLCCMPTQAHEKSIDLLTIRYEEGRNREHFEIVSVGRDEKIKLWTNTFELKMMIPFRQKSNISFLGDNSKPLEIGDSILAKSIDIYKNKILLSVSTGQIAEIELEMAGDTNQTAGDNETNRYENQTSLNIGSISEKSFSHISQSNNESNVYSSPEDSAVFDITYRWCNIYYEHSTRTRDTLGRRSYFSVNPLYPLLVTASCDYVVLIRNYETNRVVCRCYFEGLRVQCVKFSPKGTLVAVGFDNGELRLYELKMYRDTTGKIDSLTLKLYQKLTCRMATQNEEASTFKSSHMPYRRQQQKSPISIINMEFSQCATFFAVSYTYEAGKSAQSAIKVYKTRQASLSMVEEEERNVPRGSQPEVQYYFLADTVEIGSSSDQPVSTSGYSSKFIKSAYFIEFCSEIVDGSKNVSGYSSRSLSKVQAVRQDPRVRAEKTQTYLVVYEQYIDANRIRINKDNKVKVKVYLLDDKAVFTEDAKINFLKLKFPLFAYSRAFKNAYSYNQGGGSWLHSLNTLNFEEGRSGKLQTSQAAEDKIDNEVILSEMTLFKDTIIYGDTAGNLHLVKLNSLVLGQCDMTSSKSRPQKTVSVSALQRSAMNLSKTYCSHTSFISHMELTADGSYLFVGGSGDDCVVRYKIVEETPGQQLDSLCYPYYFKDVHQEYVTKSKFYDFLNNIDPIRDEISEIMLDVEEDGPGNSPKGTQLQIVRIFGRRAFDRRSNIFEDGRGNLVYTVGPNIIVENPQDSAKQRHIAADPNPYSNSPQLGCLSKNEHCLIAATEEENSRLLVWDIHSLTCLSELRLKNFSMVHHMQQSSQHPVALIYGINYLYEASMSLVDWRAQRVLGNVSLMYSGCWKIKDICEVAIKNDGLEFVSCGVQHLAYWQYVADNLVYSSFGLDSPGLSKVTLMAVRWSKDYLIAGCESGNLYLFKEFKLVHQLQVHNSVIRTLAIDGELIFSGGVDSRVCISAMLLDEAENKATIKTFEEHTIKNEVSRANTQSEPGVTKQSKVKRTQSIDPIAIKRINQQNQFILAEEDIQSIVLIKSQNRVQKIYVGTRSGNIVSIRRHFPSNESIPPPVQPPPESTKSQSPLLPVRGIARTTSIPILTQKFAIDNGEVTQVMWSHDNDTISSICFDEYNPQLFYLLTYSGCLEVWSLKTLARLYAYKLAQQANKIFCFNECVIICSERGIMAVKVDVEDNRIRFIKQMSRQYEGVITDCILSRTLMASQEEKGMTESEGEAKKVGIAYLVVGLKKSQFNEIIINELSNKIEEKFSVVNLKYQIEFMDFSRNCKYLLFKDSFEELGMVNLENFKRINTIFVEMGIEWESEGIRISPSGQKIYCSYSRENKITVLRRIGEGEIIIGDEMGTIRTFEYPCPPEKIGELHTNCYSTHMNFIKNIEIHPSEPYVLTTSVYDRSLILWKMKRPAQEAPLQKQSNRP